MRPSKPMTLVLAAALAGAPPIASAQPPKRKSDLALRVGQIEVVRAEKFAFSLCTGQKLDPERNYGATGGFGCTPANDSVRGECAPYRFRVGTIQDGLNHHLPPGVFLEPNGVLHGRISSLGALTRPGGIVCVEDDCGSKPVCQQLELTPVKATVDTRALTAGRATLGPVAAPPAAPQPGTHTSAAAPAPPATAAPSPAGAGDAAGGSAGGGGGGGGAKAVLGGLALAGVGIAGALLIPTGDGGDGGGGGGGNSCPATRTQCCAGGFGAGCGIPQQCGCPSGLRDGGICNPSGQCAPLVGGGNRICNGC